MTFKSINTLFEFLIHVESLGYVAVDFYDGSIIYDFDKDTTTICDIDFFRKKPTYNDRGDSFWGTKRLKAPEEYIFGALIDETTNVFTLGALIFHFFSSYSKMEINQMYKDSRFYPNTMDKWELSKEHYKIALEAVNEDRDMRFKSVFDFFKAWNAITKVL